MANRTTLNWNAVRTTACNATATDQPTIAKTNPKRVPMASNIFPNADWPIA